MAGGRLASVTPGANIVPIIALASAGLVTNGGLRRLPNEPPPRRALWNRPALPCRIVVPLPVMSHVKPRRGSICGMSVLRKLRCSASAAVTSPLLTSPLPGTYAPM